MAPIKCIGAIPQDVPVWILAGERDENARPEEARALYAEVERHGRLIFFAEAGHESLLDRDPVLYRQAVTAWLGEATRENTWPAR